MYASRLAVGTADGLHWVGADGDPVTVGRTIEHLAVEGPSVWAVVDGGTIRRLLPHHPDETVAGLSGVDPACLLPLENRLLVEAAAATLLTLAAGRVTRLTSFDDAPGRDGWYTPWGGPPRSAPWRTDPTGPSTPASTSGASCARRTVAAPGPPPSTWMPTSTR